MLGSVCVGVAQGCGGMQSWVWNEVDRAQLETDELLVGNFLYQGTVTDNHLGSDPSKPKISMAALLVKA